MAMLWTILQIQSYPTQRQGSWDAQATHTHRLLVESCFWGFIPGSPGLPFVLVKQVPLGREDPPGAWQACDRKLLACTRRALRSTDVAVTASARPSFGICKTGLGWLSSVVPSTIHTSAPVLTTLCWKDLSLTLYVFVESLGYVKENVLVNKNRCDRCPWEGKGE